MAIPAPPTTQPTAQGTFAKTPFAHLLIYALERRLSGTFEFNAPSGAAESLATLLVSQGRPAKVRTTAEVYGLGEVMLGLGMINEEALQTSQARMTESARLQGQILQELGVVDEAGIEAGVRAQLERKLDHLFTLPPDTLFAYFDGVDHLEHFGGAPILFDPFPALWRGIRQLPAWNHVEATMKRVGTAAVRLAASAQIERFQFTPIEARAVEMLRQPLRAVDIAQTKIVGPSVAQLLVYLLVITKQVDLVDSAQTRMSSGSMPGAQAFARVQLQTRSAARPALVIEEAPVTRNSADLRLASPYPEALPASTNTVTCEPLAENPSIPVAPSAPTIEDVVAAPISTNPLDIQEMISSTIRSSLPPPMPGEVASDDSIGTAPLSVSSLQPDPPPSPEHEALRHTIVARAAEISSLNYFQMLSLEEDATAADVQAAFIALAKVWHPDRLPSALADLRDECSKVFTHLTQAQATLCDAERRQEYMLLLKEGGATPDDQAKIQEILEAATLFQKAEIVLKRNDNAQAYELAKRAHELDPEQAEYLAMVAWLESQRLEFMGRDQTLEKIAVLDQCIALNPNSERAYFWRGMLHKRIEDHTKALRDFKKAGDLNPRNLDALREVRLHNIRTAPTKAPATPTKPETIGGMFGKLFKK